MIARTSNFAKKRVFTVTVDRCVACGKCELACAFAHGSDGKPAVTRIHIHRRGPEVGVPIVCLQCHDAGCVAVCPTDALVRNAETGAIEMVRDRCIQCRVCVAGCPFGNMAWDQTSACVQKCDLCGGEPRCVPFCPTGALRYCTPEEAREKPAPLDRQALAL